MAVNSMAKMSLLCSLTGIALLYAGAVQMRPGLTPISRIDNDFAGLKTKISGRVIDLSKHPEGHVFLKVKDSSGGVISVPIFARINSKMDEGIELLDNIQVTGKVKNYQGELELIPEKAESIQVVRSPPLEISKIDNEKLGETVKVRGVLAKKNSVGSGSLVLNLRKGDDELTVFVPQSVVESDDFPELHEGCTLQVSGSVQLYEGELELKVGSSYNLEVIEASR